MLMHKYFCFSRVGNEVMQKTIDKTKLATHIFPNTEKIEVEKYNE